MTPEEKAQVYALKKQGKTVAQIAEMMGRSETAIYYMTRREEAITELVEKTPQVLDERLNQPLDTSSKTFSDTQIQVAAQSLQAAHDLVRSIRAMSLADLMKVPVHQRAIAAGVLLDKFRLLTEQSTENALIKTQSIVQIIANTTPKRKKDAAD